MSRCLGVVLLLALAALPGIGLAQTPTEANEAGKAAYERGEYAAAERMFAGAAAAMPKEPLYHYHHGAALVRLGRYAAARAAYERARALKPAPPLSDAIEKALRDLGRTSMRGANVPDEPSDIALEDRNGVWLVEVTLNKSRRARFLVDTGATFCAISPALADELGIVVSRSAPVVTLRTANGLIEGRLASLESILVGGIEAQNVVTVVVSMKDMHLDGILGNTFLARYAATLDAQRRVLHLKPRS